MVNDDSRDNVCNRWRSTDSASQSPDISSNVSRKRHDCNDDDDDDRNRLRTSFRYKEYSQKPMITVVRHLLVDRDDNN